MVWAGWKCQGRRKQCLCVGREPAALLDPPGAQLFPCPRRAQGALCAWAAELKPCRRRTLADWGAAHPIKSWAGETLEWIAWYLGGTSGRSVLVWWLLFQETLRFSDFCIYLLFQSNFPFQSGIFHDRVPIFRPCGPSRSAPFPSPLSLDRNTCYSRCKILNQILFL